MLTIEQAFNNIVTVVQNAKMTGPEHDSLKESIQLIAGRCQVADKLEAAAKGTPSPKKKGKKNGPTNEPTNVPGTDKKVS